MLNTQIQYYKNTRDKTGKSIAVDVAINNIKLNLKALTAQYREMPKGKDKDVFKTTQFPAVTWSGTFSSRKISGLQYHSGFICIDIDKLQPEELTELQAKVNTDAHTFFSFISPSGNGLKIIFIVNIQNINQDGDSIQAQHTQAFKAIENYFVINYNVVIDTSGKDVSRLCFLCHDSNAFINTNATTFNFENFIPQQPAAVQPAPHQKQWAILTTNETNTLHHNTTDTVESVEAFTNIKLQLTSGNRNNWLYLFACNCNRKGIEINDCENHAMYLCSDKNKNEITATIRSAYTHNAAEFGKYKKQNNESKQHKKDNQKGGKFFVENSNINTQNESHSNAAQTPQTSAGQTMDDDFESNIIKFWNESINEKTGKETVNLNYTRFYEFLETQGFYNLKIDGLNVELIQIVNNIVKPVIISKTRNDAKVHLNNWCKKNQCYNVLEMLHRGQDKYFARGQFVNLGYKAIDFFKDSKDVSYHFHSNGVVKCTKDGIEFREYETGEKMLWESQINPRPFTRKPILFNNLQDVEAASDSILKNVETILSNDNKIDCVFAQYQILASSNPHNTETSLVTRMQRYLAHATSFGFLINNYKPAIGKAIVGTDHKVSINRNEQMGRTGKGILSKAIGYVTKRFSIDGRKFDPKDQAVFENLTLDSKVITVDDCHAKFDFGHFFVPITEDMMIRKLYLGVITIPYDNSPKWYFNTNFTFKGDGDSFSGRQHIIEFDDFFNKEHTPIHQFNHTLFKDWNDEEWNNFYNYAYECDCLQKQLGLVDYAEGNYLQRKLTNECPQEFIDFIEAKIVNETTGEDTEIFVHFPYHTWCDKKKLLELWTKECRENNMQITSSKGFYNMLEKYCKTNNLGFYKSKAGSIEKYWIGTKAPNLDKKTTQSVIPAANEKQTIQRSLL